MSVKKGSWYFRVHYLNASEVWANAREISDQHKKSHKVDFKIYKHRFGQLKIENNGTKYE